MNYTFFLQDSQLFLFKAFAYLGLIISSLIKNLSQYLFSNDGTEFGGSAYQKITENLESAVSLNWVSGTNSTYFGIGGKYQLDPTASVSVSRTFEERLL